MSLWQGANVRAKDRRRQEAAASNLETVEAALNRLSKAYRAAMDCVGAWHRTKGDRESLLKLGTAARSTFEDAVLWDPLVEPHVPAWMASRAKPNRPPPPALSSASHKSTVRQLAYLSLVNYADLLLSGAPLSSCRDSLLDRGIVPALEAFHSESCWSEPKIETVRRVVTALLDALALDDSDPTVWLKLACGARRLGRLLADSGTHAALLPHRRLERHALEHGQVALPQNVPPNRLLVRAYEEWCREDEETYDYPSKIVVEEPQQKLHLELSRYSWSTLGRVLLRACREGSGFRHTGVHHREQRKMEGDVMSAPSVTMHLSVVLSLPSAVLARICDFLEQKDVWRFESTCRALSYSIVSARAISAVDKSNKPAQKLLPTQTENQEVKTDHEPEKADDQPHQSEDNESDKCPGNRASIRLRSQLITEGKRSERSSRRSSTEYCLVSATLGCTPDNKTYQQCDMDYFDWESHENNTPNSVMDKSRRNVTGSSRMVTTDAMERQRREARERLSDASLSSFVNAWGTESATPVDVLFGFLAHVSIHIADVFASDPGGCMVLSSSLLESIELLVRRCSASCASLVPSWTASDGLPVPRSPRLGRLELFSIDLVHAELRLKRCDREEVVRPGFDSDGNFLSLVVPSLVATMDDLDKKTRHRIHRDSLEWVGLKTRCLWLAAGFYFWRARMSRNVSESREAELEGLGLLERAIACLAPPGKRESLEFPTPHLDSPARIGQHWKLLSVSTLSAFLNEIQASSVVLKAQEEFLEATSRVEVIDPSQHLSDEDSTALAFIGDTLLKRYDTALDAPQPRYGELLEDFLSVHGDSLLAIASTDDIGMQSDGGLREWFDTVVPASRIDVAFLLALPSSPSILSILITCLKVREERTPDCLRLFTRLAVTAARISRALVKVTADSMRGNDTAPRGADDDDSFASSHEDFGLDGPEPRTDEMKLRQLALLLELLIKSIRKWLSGAEVNVVDSLASSDGFLRMVNGAMAFAAARFASPSYRLEENGERGDLRVLLALKSLMMTIQRHGSQDVWMTLGKEYAYGLIRVICDQAKVMKSIAENSSGRQSKPIRQRLIKRRSDVVTEACCTFGTLLSEEWVYADAGLIQDAKLFAESAARQAILPVLCKSLLWLWKTGLNNDFSTKDRLFVPVTIAMVGFCGSASLHGSEGSVSSTRPSLDDFYDSDASARDCLSEVEEEDGGDNRVQRRTELLRAVAQAVHCIDSTFGVVQESDAMSFGSFGFKGYDTPHGPLLPIVAARVLNRLADTLLVTFAAEGSPLGGLWMDYPFGTRTTGLLLDSLLYKAYKCLHGFTLVHSGDPKESSSSGRSSAERFLPENVAAAASLYRCVMRAYSQGRKSPPKAALDTVMDALPPLGETAKSQVIRNYLFGTNGSQWEPKAVTSLLSKSDTWTDRFGAIQALGADGSSSAGSVPGGDEATIVRVGISNLIAQGALPTYQDGGNDRDERATSVIAEEELSRKFTAVFDNLCVGDHADWEAWFKAAQCLISKADLIADRLGLTRGFSRIRGFTVPDRLGTQDSSLTLSDLIEEQDRETVLKEEGWAPYLGNDLSLYCCSNWSSFPSLQSCAAEVGRHLAVTDDPDSDSKQNLLIHRRHYEDIATLASKKDFAAWQQTWGGIFVAALRTVGLRCIGLALCFAPHDPSPEEHQQIAEVAESLGVLLYSELSGSQVYGYPMHEMPPCKRRHVAEASLACFERAVDLLSDDDEEQSQSHPKWDLRFLVGKCHEKIANTYRREAFPCGALTGSSIDEPTSVRKYEWHMRTALKSYADALEECKQLEKDGQVEEQTGGSNHGVVEVFYRLHASRLKCLINGVNRREDERNLAELEAARLAESHWLKPPDETSNILRDRIWTAFSDTVAALAQCRLDHSFFHRSVYRHAQALMWAPVLCDPLGGLRKGSLGEVPATRAFKIRGLNYSTHAADSGAAVIGSLFEKKRSQLCAVWVTSSTSPSPFQAINNSVRKYDALRGKYIGAYLESLRLCNKRNDIETFLRWVLACPRDLPSYFAASALSQGGVPKTLHVDDPLLIKSRSLSSFFFLTTVKRQANSALAATIVHDLQAHATTSSSDNESQLKAAYACFLRLNCKPEELIKNRSWKYHQHHSSGASTKDVVEALTTSFLRVSKESPLSGAPGDWSGESQVATLVKAAIARCKKLFPNLSSTYCSKKRTPKKKRKEPQTIKKSFDVKVPEGLSGGDTFVVSVDIHGEQKKVRLTVPEQPVQVMRFSLEVPATEPAPESAKKARANEEAA